MTRVLPQAAPRGWITPGGTVLLEQPDGALTTVDGAGSAGLVAAPLAAEVRAALRGAPASPLVQQLFGDLSEARDLEPLGLLRRGGWGQLFLELVAGCNERCLHCYAESSPARKEALTRAAAEAVLRDAAALGFRLVQFTGGEALLCPFLGDLVAQAFALGLDVEVYTNGTLLSAARLAELEGAAFAFSLYADDPAVHDAVTRLPGSHARTLAAIERVVAAGARARVSVILTRPEHEAAARGALELARSLGVSGASLDASRAVGRGGQGGQAVEPSPREGEPAGVSGPHRGEGVSADLGTIAVLPDGRVVPCILSRELVLGRVGERGGLRQALTRPPLRIVAADAARRAAANLSRMTCAPCRLAAALLRPSEGAA